MKYQIECDGVYCLVTYKRYHNYIIDYLYYGGKHIRYISKDLGHKSVISLLTLNSLNEIRS